MFYDRYLYAQELRSTFDAEARATGNATLLLTALLATSKGLIDNGYEVPKIAE